MRDPANHDLTKARFHSIVPLDNQSPQPVEQVQAVQTRATKVKRIHPLVLTKLRPLSITSQEIFSYKPYVHLCSQHVTKRGLERRIKLGMDPFLNLK